MRQSAQNKQASKLPDLRCFVTDCDKNAQYDYYYFIIETMVIIVNAV